MLKTEKNETIYFVVNNKWVNFALKNQIFCTYCSSDKQWFLKQMRIDKKLDHSTNILSLVSTGSDPEQMGNQMGHWEVVNNSPK